MSNKLGQEPAFPLVAFNEQGEMTTTEYFNGMSKRFYAACAAMQGIISSPVNYNMEDKIVKTNIEICKLAYLFADELIKQENNEQS